MADDLPAPDMPETITRSFELGGRGAPAVAHRPVRLRWAYSSRPIFAGRPGTLSSSSREAARTRLRRAEVLEQRALARRADAGQLVEDRLGHRLVAAGAVVGDREAVRLVAHALQQLQLRRVVGEPQRLAHAGQEDLLDALGQRDDRDAALAEVLRARARPADELAPAAVDHDHVRQRREARVAVLVVGRQLALGLELRRRRRAAPRSSRRSRRTPVDGRGCVKRR